MVVTGEERHHMAEGGGCGARVGAACTTMRGPHGAARRLGECLAFPPSPLLGTGLEDAPQLYIYMC